jgi:hypothetical protein
MDLDVDYQLLGSIHSALEGVSREFEDIQTTQAGFDGDMGSADVTGAMENFAGNWSYHRKKLISELDNLLTLVEKAIQGFRHADESAAAALHGKK